MNRVVLSAVVVFLLCNGIIYAYEDWSYYGAYTREWDENDANNGDIYKAANTEIVDALIRAGFPDFGWEEHRDINLDAFPIYYGEIKTGLDGVRAATISGHGASTGMGTVMAAEIYSTDIAGETALDASWETHYCPLCGDQEYCYTDLVCGQPYDPDNPLPACECLQKYAHFDTGAGWAYIGISSLGIGEYLLDGNIFNITSEDKLLVLDYCHSMGNASTFIDAVGFDLAVVGSDDQDPQLYLYQDLRKMWSRLGCINWTDPYTGKKFTLDSFKEAVDGVQDDIMYMHSDLTFLEVTGNESGHLGIPCDSPAPSNFIDGGCYDGILYWICRKNNYVDNYRLYRSDGDGGQRVLIAEVPAEVVGPNDWCKVYTYTIDGLSDYYEIEEVYYTGGLRVSRYLENVERPLLWDSYMSGNYEVIVDIPSVKRSEVGKYSDITNASFNEGYDYVVVANELSITASLRDYIDAKSKNYIVYYGYDVNSSNVPQLYGQAINDNTSINAQYHGWERWPVSPGPQLVIVGGAQSTISPIIIEDYNGGCNGPGNTCMSDYLMTDINDDMVPDGPMIRLPVDGEVGVNTIVASAIQYESGGSQAPYNQVMIICDDKQCAECYIPMQAVASRYEDIGFFPRMNRSSLLSDPYYLIPYQIAEDMINDGVNEIFGFGDWSGSHYWYGYIGTNFPYQNLTRQQSFVAWIPSCTTARTGATESVTRNLMIEWPSLCNTSMCAMVGHLNTGYADYFEEYIYNLVDERVVADGTDRTVAQIAYDALMSTYIEKPLMLYHLLGVGVLGMPVEMPTCIIPTNITEEDNGDEGRMKINIRNNVEAVICEYEIGMPGKVEIAIYDIRGREVAQLYAGYLAEGKYRAVWDIRTIHGARAASGVYLCRLSSDDGNELSAKITIVK